VRHPFDGTPALQVARTLASKYDVLALPGAMFGPDQQEYLRFAFANLDAADFPELVERLLASQR
jgi:aspartate/methionine/tyrosine aminotransferase